MGPLVPESGTNACAQTRAQANCRIVLRECPQIDLSVWCSAVSDSHLTSGRSVAEVEFLA